MSAHANMVKMTVSSVSATPSTGKGDITLNAASTGFQSFADAYGGNATVDILITKGAEWEVARNCTYTHSGTTLTRGTWEDSSNGTGAIVADNTAVVSVVATAAVGNNAALNHVAASPTTAGVTGVVGTMHLLDISGLTASRNFTLPATAAVGDRVGVYITAGDATYELVIIGDTGDTINGGSAATEWSRLFITNECVILRCVTANSAWIVEYDGRKIPFVDVTGDGSTTQNVARDSNVQVAAVLATVASDSSSNWDATNKRLAPRRPGVWQISTLCTMILIQSGQPCLTFLQKGGGGAYVGNSPVAFGNASSAIGAGVSTSVRMAAGETLEFYVFYNDASTNRATSSGANENYFRAFWVEDL